MIGCATALLCKRYSCTRRAREPRRRRAELAGLDLETAGDLDRELDRRLSVVEVGGGSRAASSHARRRLSIGRGARGAPAGGAVPAQMQEMFASFNAWREKFKDQIVDLGGKLKGGGKILTTSGVTDGPFVEMKEVIGGYMVVVS